MAGASLVFPSSLPPPTRQPQRGPSLERPEKRLGARKMRRFVNDNFLDSEIALSPVEEEEPFSLGAGTRFSDPAVLMMVGEELDPAEVDHRSVQRERPPPAPLPPGATRVAGRAAAMLGKLDAETRAVLLAYKSTPALRKAEEALRAYLRSCVADHIKAPSGGCDAEAGARGRRRGARRGGRQCVPARGAPVRPCRPQLPTVTLAATENEALRRALRGACQFYCLRAQSVAGRTRTSPRATLAQLLPPATEERWRGLAAAAEVSLVSLLLDATSCHDRASASRAPRAGELAPAAAPPASFRRQDSASSDEWVLVSAP